MAVWKGKRSSKVSYSWSSFHLSVLWLVQAYGMLILWFLRGIFMISVELVSACHFVVVSSYLVVYLQRNSSFTLGCLQISELLLHPFHRKDDVMINLNLAHLG